MYRCCKTILPQKLFSFSVYCKCSLLFSCVRSALRNWQFQVSKDGTSWVTLRTHKDDTSLNEPGSTATWSLSPPEDEKQGWRHIKIQQTGRNASGQTHYLSVSGLEIYGSVNGVCDDLGKKIILFQQWFLKMFRNWEDSENANMNFLQVKQLGRLKQAYVASEESSELRCWNRWSLGLAWSGAWTGSGEIRTGLRAGRELSLGISIMVGVYQ